MDGNNERLKKRIAYYYQITEGGYRRWGTDPDRPNIYSLHFGFWDEEQVVKPELNQCAIKRLMSETIRVAEIEDGMSVLDAGCGTGTFAYEVRERFPSTKVVGINIANNHLITALTLNERNTRSPYFSLQDFRNPAFPNNQFDRVVFLESFVHSYDKNGLAREVNRILKPNGTIFMAEYLKIENDNSRGEEKLWRNLHEGWEISNFATKTGLSNSLVEAGFSSIRVNDLTARIMPSAKFLWQDCKRKLQEDRAMIEVTKNNRLASVAFYDLLERGCLGYFFVTGTKNENHI